MHRGRRGIGQVVEDLFLIQRTLTLDSLIQTGLADGSLEEKGDVGFAAGTRLGTSFAERLKWDIF